MVCAGVLQLQLLTLTSTELPRLTAIPSDTPPSVWLQFSIGASNGVWVESLLSKPSVANNTSSDHETGCSTLSGAISWSWLQWFWLSVPRTTAEGASRLKIRLMIALPPSETTPVPHHACVGWASLPLTSLIPDTSSEVELRVHNMSEEEEDASADGEGTESGDVSCSPSLSPIFTPELVAPRIDSSSLLMLDSPEIERDEPSELDGRLPLSKPEPLQPVAEVACTDASGDVGQLRCLLSASSMPLPTKRLLDRLVACCIQVEGHVCSV